ncbi:MAG TPA: hypothetical protein PKM25_04785 [Candidatus Ozemobacteraceae bacterium]|nr:hypothetical protein [Candidatus Ozemobacteraceae bacterium]
MDQKQELLELVGSFIENETSLAALYQACVEFMPEHKEVWEALQRQEEQHAEVFKQIRRSIEEVPHNWSRGKFFPQTLRLMTDDLKRTTDQIRSKTVNRRYVVQHMMDTENSLIESELSRSFTTSDEQFKILMNKLQEETTNHRNLLRGILAKI